MKAKLLLILLIACVTFSSQTFGQATHKKKKTPTADNCPPEGSATDDKHKTLNIHKNASTEAPSGTPDNWDIESVIGAPKHEDSTDFTVGSYVALKGFLVSFQEEGGESCNCGLAVAAEKTGDVHMYIGLTAGAPKTECVIVEITPDFKRLHPDYEQMLNAKTQVTVSGYLLYDIEHTAQSMNTCKSCTKTWRKTCWEIHPIVSIK